MTDYRSRAVNAVYGLAYGDAFGYRTEFQSHAQIVREHGVQGPKRPVPTVISDDTQMSLAVWNALNAYGELTVPLTYGSATRLAEEMAATYLMWAADPDNNRAPGSTCLGSLARLTTMSHEDILRCTDTESKGCGSVMRAPWIGVHPGINEDLVSSVAQLSAVMTHGHPTAIVAATVAAQLTWKLSESAITLADAPAAATELTLAFRYDQTVLGDLWERAGYASAEEFALIGIHETVEALSHVATAAQLIRDNPGFDPCDLTGQGWTADTCLATALALAVSAVRGDAAATLARAAATNGDSDSIGAVCGALLGAGGAIFPQSWKADLEPRYRDELEAVASQIEAS